MPGNYDDIPVGTQSTDNYGDIPVDKPTQTIGTGEAFGRGFANNASFGLGKVVNGMVGAAINKWDSNPGEIASSIAASTPKTGEGFWADVGASIKEQREANQAAYEQHKLAYGAGAVTGALPSLALTGAGQTVGRAAVTGAGLGAVEGGAESSNLRELGTNVALGGTIGGVLGGAGTGISNLVRSAGTTGVRKILDRAVEDSQSLDDSISQRGLAKLHDLFDGGETALNERELLKTGKGVQKFLEDPEIDHIAKAQMIGGISKGALPTGSQLATGAFNSAVQLIPGEVAGGVAGHLASGHSVTGATIGGLVNAAMSPVARGFAQDVGTLGAMKYAGNNTAQLLGGQISPLVGGQIGGNTQSNLPGLDGILGNYINSNWLGK